MSTNLILCGVGGQGTILASKLIANAALARGLSVKTAETIGMAQRGGSVVSHIRLGKGCSSPLMAHGEADLILSFEPAEAVRQLAYLKPGGTVVTCTTPIVPVSAMTGGPDYDVEAVLGTLRANVGHLVEIDRDDVVHDLMSDRVLNVVLLGAAASTGVLGIAVDELQAAVRRLLPGRFVELNLRALMWGMSHEGV